MLRVMENFHDNITITLFFTNFRANVMNNLMIHAALQSTSLTDLSISVSYKSLKLLVLLKPLELNDRARNCYLYVCPWNQKLLI